MDDLRNSDSLSQITQSLRRIQTEGGDSNFVIFTSDASKNYYIQFACAKGKTVLYAEAAGNGVLDEEDKLTADKVNWLLDSGWYLRGSESMPNFFRKWDSETDEDREAIAQATLQAMAETYGMDLNQPLQVELVLE
jgi:hypothetical protein